MNRPWLMCPRCERMASPREAIHLGLGSVQGSERNFSEISQLIAVASGWGNRKNRAALLQCSVVSGLETEL